MVVVVAALSGCSSGYDQCMILTDEVHKEAFLYQVKNLKIDYKLNDQGDICMPDEIFESDKLLELQNRVNAYYRGVAEMLTNNEEQDNALGWLSRENIPHSVSESPRGKFLIIYSRSPAEAEEYRAKLNNVLRVESAAPSNKAPQPTQ